MLSIRADITTENGNLGQYQKNKYSMNQEQEKTALVTGGTKGIGYGIAEKLIGAGYRVAITGRNLADAQAAADRLNENHPKHVLAIEADVRDFKDQQRAVKEIVAAWGRVDILVANAGLGHFGSIQDITHDQWNDTIDTNLTGVFNSVKASLDELIKNKGYIITIGSLAGTNFFKGGSAYNASKFAITGFSQAIMLDLRHHGVKVTTIMPGSVTSHFNDHTPSPDDAWKIQPEDIGQMILDLLRMHPRTLPSKIEVRPAQPPAK